MHLLIYVTLYMYVYMYPNVSSIALPILSSLTRDRDVATRYPWMMEALPILETELDTTQNW